MHTHTHAHSHAYTLINMYACAEAAKFIMHCGCLSLMALPLPLPQPLLVPPSLLQLRLMRRPTCGDPALGLCSHMSHTWISQLCSWDNGLSIGLMQHGTGPSWLFKRFLFIRLQLFRHNAKAAGDFLYPLTHIPHIHCNNSYPTISLTIYELRYTHRHSHTHFST